MVLRRLSSSFICHANGAKNTLFSVLLNKSVTIILLFLAKINTIPKIHLLTDRMQKVTVESCIFRLNVFSFFDCAMIVTVSAARRVASSGRKFPVASDLGMPMFDNSRRVEMKTETL